MSGLLAQMFMGGVQDTAQGISERLREEARQKREQALLDDRFVKQKQLQDERISSDDKREAQRHENNQSNARLAQSLKNESRETWSQGQDERGSYQQSSSGKREYYGSQGAGKLSPEKQLKYDTLREQLTTYQKNIEFVNDPVERKALAEKMDQMVGKMNEIAGINYEPPKPGDLLKAFMSNNPSVSEADARTALAQKYPNMGFDAPTKEVTPGKPAPNALPTPEGGDAGLLSATGSGKNAGLSPEDRAHKAAKYNRVQSLRQDIDQTARSITAAESRMKEGPRGMLSLTKEGGQVYRQQYRVEMEQQIARLQQLQQQLAQELKAQ